MGGAQAGDPVGHRRDLGAVYADREVAAIKLEREAGSRAWREIGHAHRRDRRRGRNRRMKLNAVTVGTKTVGKIGRQFEPERVDPYVRDGRRSIAHPLVVDVALAGQARRRRSRRARSRS